MSLRVESRLHDTFGACIGGVDPSQPVSGDLAEDIRRHLDEYGILLFRCNRPLAPAEQVRFVSNFGTLEVLPMEAVPGAPCVFRTTNKAELGGLLNAGVEGWHNDGLYRAVPTDIVTYHLIEVPAVGGDTLFANGHLAYETLPETVRQKVDEAVAVHGKEGEGASTVHRMVRVHPRSGRKALYLALGFASTTPGTFIVMGWPQEELEQTFGFLDQHLRQPAMMYRHKWRSGDLVMTDNAAVLHLAERTDPSYPRVLHRVSVAGAADYRLQHAFGGPMRHRR